MYILNPLWHNPGLYEDIMAAMNRGTEGFLMQTDIPPAK
jgi:hypothetical protein